MKGLAAFGAGNPQEHSHGGESQDAQRNVDDEGPAPAGPFGQPTAQERTGHRRHREDGTHDAHVLTALAGRDDIGNGRL